MSTPQSRKAARIAQLFHEYYEQLAPEYGYKTREASAVPWERVPLKNRALMIATVEHVLERLCDELEEYAPNKPPGGGRV
jgi:hypothetical protein